MTAEKDPSAFVDAVIDRLHQLAGYCGHCGKNECAGKKEHSKLPAYLSTKKVIAALWWGEKNAER